MFWRLRVGAAVYRIVNQPAGKKWFDTQREHRLFVTSMSDVIMSKYSVEAHREYRRHSIDSIALSLAASALIDMERTLVDDRDFQVIAAIGVLQGCMVAFSEMYGKRDMVSAYVAKHAEIRAELGT